MTPNIHRGWNHILSIFWNFSLQGRAGEKGDTFDGTRYPNSLHCTVPQAGFGYRKCAALLKNLQADHRKLAESMRTFLICVCKELLEGAIKMHRCPGIVFTEGVSARRARIAGTGIEVLVLSIC